MAIKKVYIFIFFSLIISMLFINHLGGQGHKKGENIASNPTLASCNELAEQNKDLLDLLLKASSEKRCEIIKEHRDKIDDIFMNRLFREINEYANNSESLETLKNLLAIALEISDYRGDKKSKGKYELISSLIEYVEKKDRNFLLSDKGLNIFKEIGDKKGEAGFYALKGFMLINWANYKEGIYNLEKSLSIYKKIGDKRDEADMLLDMAMVFTKFCDYEKAIMYYQKASDIYDNINCPMKKAITHQLMASSFSKTGFMKKALMELDCAYEILDSIAEDEGSKEKDGKEIYYPDLIEMSVNYDRDVLVMSNYREHGVLYLQMGKYEEALKSYQKELELAMVKGNKQSEISALWHIGSVYAKLGQKEKTIEYFEKSLSINSQHMDKTMKSINYYLLAWFYLKERNDLNLALECFQKGIDCLDKIEVSVLKDLMKALGMRCIGEAYVEKDKLEAAEEYLKKALKIFETNQKVYGNQEDHIYHIYRDLGTIYLKKKKYDKSLAYYNKALNISKKYFLKGDKAAIYENFGYLYDEQKNYEKAILNYKEALKIHKLISYPDDIWRNLFSIGKLYQKRGDFNDAYEYYKSSIDIIEKMRQDIKVEDFKIHFMKDKIEVYEAMVELLIEMKRDRDALEYSERARNRAFLDILSNQKVDFRHGAPQELIDREDELSFQIRTMTSQLGQEREKSEKIQNKILIKKISSDLEKAKSDYEDLMEKIQLKCPEYASCISVYPDKIENIQKLLDGNSVLMEYFIGKEKTFLWIISNDKIKTFIISVGSDEIKKYVQKYREEIAENITVSKIHSNRWKDMAGKLYNILIKGKENVLKGKSQIIVVSDGSLNYLPFQTLIDKNGKFLVENYNILYLPSASVLKYCRKKNTLANNKFLGFNIGNLSVEGYAPLPHSKDEVCEIAELYKNSTIYSEKEMTVKEVCEKSRNCDILHFATHSILDMQSPLFSSLILSDGRLEIYKVFNMNLSAYLVTLSACSTGLGELLSGDELIGLSRAFIYAGTPTVCVSLWDVSDISTSELMAKFYYYLKEGKTKSEALRLAQLDVMKKYPHPFFWAPFVLIGDWR